MVQFTEVFLTYKDVKEANPGWTDRMIEDYLSLKRAIAALGEAADANVNIALLQAQLNELRECVGSCDFITWDDTGLTWDSENITFDMTEA